MEREREREGIRVGVTLRSITTVLERRLPWEMPDAARYNNPFNIYKKRRMKNQTEWNGRRKERMRGRERERRENLKDMVGNGVNFHRPKFAEESGDGCVLVELREERHVLPFRFDGII
jgi:hypothetical protein